MGKLNLNDRIFEEISYEDYISALATVTRFHRQIDRNAELIGKRLLSDPTLDLYIEDLGFSARVKKVFLELNIQQVKDIIDYGVNKLKNNRNIGKKSMVEINAVLRELELPI